MTSTAAEVLLTQHQLSAITAPRAIALIGASGDPKRLTSRPQRFLQQHEFCGNIIPINPARAVVLERRSYPSVADVDGPIDLAYILLGTDHVETQLTACVHAGVAAVAVLADGYAERGADGLARQKRLVEIANEAGLALIGPNSMGLADTRSRAICTTNAAFAVNDIRQGRTAVLSQSGSLIGTILSRGQALGAAYATFISTGNEAQLTVGDFGEALVDDPTIDSFVLFLETMRAPDRFARFAAAAKSAGKPIVAYQVGASDEGRALAMSHTGAMVTGPGALSAFLDAHGVSEVKTFDALFEAPRALLAARRRHDLPARPPKDRGALVVTTTGGGGAIMVDQLGLRGVPLCSPSDATRAELANAGIHHGGGPLIDVTLAGANQETMTRVIETLVTADEVGLLITAIGSSAQFNPELAVRPVIEAAKRDATAAAPVFAFPLPHAPESHALFAEAGIASFRTPESAADAARHVLKLARSAMRTSRSDEIGATVELKTTERRVAALPSGMCNERQSGDILRALGVNLARSVFVKAGDDLADAIRDWTGHWPVVVKLVSRDIAHKSDVGAVRVGLETADAVMSAVSDMFTDVQRNKPGADMAGVLVQDMQAGLGEAIIGFTRDPAVGPLVTIGAGGITTEIYTDTVTGVAPVSRAAARDMIDRVRGFAVFRGFRGRPVGDLEKLADMLVAISQLALIPRVAEAEINPVIVSETGAIGVDALVRLT